MARLPWMALHRTHRHRPHNGRMVTHGTSTKRALHSPSLSPFGIRFGLFIRVYNFLAIARTVVVSSIFWCVDLCLLIYFIFVNILFELLYVAHSPIKYCAFKIYIYIVYFFRSVTVWQLFKTVCRRCECSEEFQIYRICFYLFF